MLGALADLMALSARSNELSSDIYRTSLLRRSSSRSACEGSQVQCSWQGALSPPLLRGYASTACYQRLHHQDHFLSLQRTLRLLLCRDGPVEAQTRWRQPKLLVQHDYSQHSVMLLLHALRICAVAMEKLPDNLLFHQFESQALNLHCHTSSNSVLASSRELTLPLFLPDTCVCTRHNQAADVKRRLGLQQRLKNVNAFVNSSSWGLNAFYSKL
jgi:hypothetical protein